MRCRSKQPEKTFRRRLAWRERKTSSVASPHRQEERRLDQANTVVHEPTDLFTDLPACEDGHFRILDRPGHGIEPAPGAQERYRAR